MNNKRLGRFVLWALSLFPKRYAIESSKQLAAPFFIINSGRCGSTLLNRLLNQHQDLFLPPEQYFIHQMIIKFRLYNWILWRDLAKVLAGELVPSLSAHNWEWKYEDTFKEIVAAKGSERSLQSVIDRVLRNYALQQGKAPRLWGDATPLNSSYVPEIFNAYPKAKYLYLTRDARDVVASYKQGEDAPFALFKDPKTCASNWCLAYEMTQKLQRKGVEVLHLRYEELVQNPNEVLNTVFDFLAVPKMSIDTKRLDVPDIAFYQLPYHAGLQRPVHTKSIGKWKNELSQRELEDIMPVVSPTMKALGYL